MPFRVRVNHGSNFAVAEVSGLPRERVAADLAAGEGPAPQAPAA